MKQDEVTSEVIFAVKYLVGDPNANGLIQKYAGAMQNLLNKVPDEKRKIIINYIDTKTHTDVNFQ